MAAAVMLLGATWASVRADGEEKATAEDAAVVSAAVQHFGSEKDAPSFAGREGKTSVLVHTESAGPAALYLSDDQIRADTAGEKWEVPTELRESLRKRNAAKVPLAGLTLGRGVVAADLDKALAPRDWEGPEKYSDARAFARVWLPAYSKDGRTAVVRFAFGPTAHGATATYLLTKAEGGWKVTKWKLAYYA